MGQDAGEAIGQGQGRLFSAGGDEAAQSIAGERAYLEKQFRDKAAKIGEQIAAASKATPEEIANLDKMNAQMEKVIGMAEFQLNKVTSSSDLSREAAQKALSNISSLLGGEASGATNPFLQQRKRQRDQLEGQLAREFGPGYASTSAGQNLLNNFDEQTNYQTQNINQSALSNQVGAFTSLNQQANQGFDAAQQFGQFGANLRTNYLNASNVLKNREVGGLTTQANALIGAGSGAQYGGAQYVGDLYRAGVAQNVGQQSFAAQSNFAGSFFGGIGGKGGGA